MENRELFYKKMKERLLAKKDELAAFIKKMSQDDLGAGERQIMDSADEASSINMQNLQSSIQKAEINEVKLIEEALSRLNKGEYGICTSCGKPISAARLEYYPYVARCISCQEEHES